MHNLIYVHSSFIARQQLLLNA